MTGVSHKQARLYIQAAQDGLLKEGKQSALEEHLKVCKACRAYSDELSGITTNLKDAFHSRWDTQQRRMEPLIENVLSQRCQTGSVQVLEFLPPWQHFPYSQ
jgi:predicted anti-sigma-YlaC factor YlaD